VSLSSWDAFLIHALSQLANAYVSGMKEDLNITGNQYTYMGTIYNAVSDPLDMSLLAPSDVLRSSARCVSPPTSSS
jgi:hypothetical protein